MEFQLLDVDYMLVNEQPVVRLLGKDQHGKTVCGFYEGYQPYFYAEDPRVTSLLAGNPQVVKTEQVERRRVTGYQGAVPMVKITLVNPARTPEIRDMLHAQGITTYESDILFKYRFMADHDLYGCGWIRAGSSNGVATKTVFADRTCQIQELQTIARKENAPLRILSLDIECCPTEEGSVPDAAQDPIIMIALVFSESYKGADTIVLSTRPDPAVMAMDTEKEMLEELIQMITAYDPDMITGYNINNFDLPYILDRMRYHSIRPVFGRCKQKPVIARKFAVRYRISIFGRVIVDSYELVKKDFSLKRYDLNTVAQGLLGKGKVDVKHSEIEQLWKGEQEGFRKLAEYCKMDALLALQLVEHLQLLDKYVALSTLSGVLLQDSLDSGETTRIENYLLREYNKRGFVLPTKPSPKEIAQREKRKKVELKGGFVIEPVKTLHSSILVLDFKSMYPSIIRSFNICSTTLITDQTVENPIISPSGARFVPKEVQEGVIPTILEELMKRRGQVKKLMKREKDPNRHRVLYAEQWAIKIMANAFYGHIGYSRARIYNLGVANAITAYGREIIQKTKRLVEEEFGYKIVYGDTDSVMVKVDEEDMDTIKAIGAQIAERVTTELPGVMELEFEKVFKRFLPLTKKRYMAWSFEPTEDGWTDRIEMKGVETVRRDWCPLVSESMNTVVELILKKSDVKGSVQYFKELAGRLLKNEIDIQKLVITKGVSRSIKSYAGIQPHIELVKKMRIRNPADAPGIGDRVGYVIVKGTGLVSKRAEDPSYIIEKGLQVDSHYYIENQLLPPLERIFAVLGIEKAELFGNGKQLGLFESLRNGHAHAPSVLKEIPLTEVNGFICQKCSHFYERPPLIGVCECGGGFWFSSPKGPAEMAVVA